MFKIKIDHKKQENEGL